MKCKNVLFVILVMLTLTGCTQSTGSEVVETLKEDRSASRSTGQRRMSALTRQMTFWRY